MELCLKCNDDFDSPFRHNGGHLLVNTNMVELGLHDVPRHSRFCMKLSLFIQVLFYPMWPYWLESSLEC